MPADPGAHLAELERLFREEGPRIWFLMGHEKPYHRKSTIEMVERVATRVDGIGVKRTAAYLYEAKAERPGPEGGDASR